MSVLNVPKRRHEVNRTCAVQDYLRQQHVPRAKVVYYHGWISRARCADVFVEAMRFVQPGITLFFLGPIEQEFKHELQDMARKYGIADRVIFHPMVATDDLMAFAASADLGLQAQLNVGLNSYYCAPIKLFQYLSVGLPVIASNFPGMIEVVEENEVGLCVNPENAQDVATAIDTILGDDAVHRKMSENAVRVSREKYCYEVEGGKLLDAIDHLVGPG